MITKENLIGAYFIDSDRKNIEVLTTSEDKKQIIPTIMPFDENNHSFKELTSVITAIFEQNENEDQLFALKLALFELTAIRDSKDLDLKKKLRQCKNKIDTLKVAFELVGS